LSADRGQDESYDEYHSLGQQRVLEHEESSGSARWIADLLLLFDFWVEATTTEIWKQKVIEMPTGKHEPMTEVPCRHELEKMQLGFEALEAWKDTYLDEVVHFELRMTKKSAVEILAEFETATESDQRNRHRPAPAPAPAPGEEDGGLQGQSDLRRQGVFCYLIPVGSIWEAQGLLWGVLVDLKVPVKLSHDLHQDAKLPRGLWQHQTQPRHYQGAGALCESRWYLRSAWTSCLGPQTHFRKKLQDAELPRKHFGDGNLG